MCRIVFTSPSLCSSVALRRTFQGYTLLHHTSISGSGPGRTTQLLTQRSKYTIIFAPQFSLNGVRTLRLAILAGVLSNSHHTDQPQSITGFVTWSHVLSVYARTSYTRWEHSANLPHQYVSRVSHRLAWPQDTFYRAFRSESRHFGAS